MQSVACPSDAELSSFAEGRLSADEIPTTTGYKPPTGDFIDGQVYDGRKPNAYLASFAIGNQAAAGAARLAP